jgi:hypothetical protein
VKKYRSFFFGDEQTVITASTECNVEAGFSVQSSVTEKRQDVCAAYLSGVH